MRFAYIKKGVVYDSIEVRPETIFYPHYASLFVEVPDEVRSGWTFDGTNFIAPPAPQTMAVQETLTKEQLMVEIATLTAKVQALE